MCCSIKHTKFCCVWDILSVVFIVNHLIYKLFVDEWNFILQSCHHKVYCVNLGSGACIYCVAWLHPYHILFIYNFIKTTGQNLTKHAQIILLGMKFSTAYFAFELGDTFGFHILKQEINHFCLYYLSSSTHLHGTLMHFRHLILHIILHYVTYLKY